MASDEQTAWIDRVLNVRASRGEATPDVASLRGAAARLVGEVKSLRGTTTGTQSRLNKGLAALDAQLAQGDAAAAHATLVTLAGIVDEADARARNPSALDQAMRAWAAARTAAAAPLQEILAKIGDLDHPGTARAALQIRSVIRNISIDPETARQAADLAQWLQADDIIDKVEKPNGFGITVNVRDPLLRALRALTPVLEAGQ